MSILRPLVISLLLLFACCAPWVSNTPFDNPPDAVGDGVHDDTAALANALANCGTGQKVQISRKYLIGSVTIPTGCTLGGYVGIPEPMYQQAPFAVNPYTFNSLLILKAGATITMDVASAITGVMIVHADLSLPATTDAQATTLLAQFADTAITNTTGSVLIDMVGIFGFAQAVNISNPGNNGPGRSQVFHLWGDNLAGLKISDSPDVSHVAYGHMWPFLTFTITGVSDANLQRPGAAYWYLNVDDWFDVHDNFSFGYAYCVRAEDTSALSMNHQQCDYPATGGGTYGIYFAHNAGYGPFHVEYASCVNCQIIGYANGIYVDTVGAPTGNDTFQLTGSRIITTGIGLELVHGFALVTGNLWQNQATAAIKIDSDAAGGYFDSSRFAGVGAQYSVDPAAAEKVTIRDAATHITGCDPTNGTPSTLNGLHLNFNCNTNAAWIWSVQNGVAWREMDIDASALFIGKFNPLNTTPGGKQPLCIDTTTKQIYQGNAGAC